MIDVNKTQRQASNPLSSVWVSASAGSGKTKVLSDRVLNLLLLNGKPEKLLCLTFTKAAAAEMANRVTGILKNWAVCSDEELASHIENLTGETPEEETLVRARRLFAEVLETPGGMKIMTIHSFCQSVLMRFPLEAGVPPNFDIIDDVKAQALLFDALEEVLSLENLQPDIRLLAGYQTLDQLTTLLKSLLSHRSKLLELTARNSLEYLIHELKRNFNIENYQSEKQIIQSSFNPDEWDSIKNKYLSKNGMPDGRKKVTDTALKACETEQKIRNFRLVRLTAALLNLAYEILKVYQNKKRAAGLLDYNDLIDDTKKLLEKSHAAAWVLFKLDGGIDHILVDEAQDTNPDQWAIIRLLAEEFFSGEDHHDTIRTIFAVGDKKQSIYSFQGAEPSEFERMRLLFDEKVRASENEFETIPFNLSFRSTRPVLELVNRVLSHPQARKGILLPNEQATHVAYRDQDAGLVEVWPLEESIKADQPQPWKPPIERVQNQSALSRLAEKIALRIQEMIENGELLESAGRPVCPGDFLILVQRRQQLVTEIVRQLKEKGIPVAGIDRLDLGTHIAVQDMMAAAKFALLPEDDLNLACLLKSPLIKMTEDDLFQAAYGREKQTLWQRVQALFPKQADILKSFLNQADKVPPYEFFAYILGPAGGRRHFVSRLGMEANEALDEFLNLALSFEQNEVPSLQHFVDWMDARQKIEIKRDMESSQNAVRVMTVHGSKGLQGNIVFIPQTNALKRNRPPFIWVNGIPLWVPNQEMRSQETQALQTLSDEEEDDESRRLLYVALTRARDRLYICGYKNAKNFKTCCWYDLIRESLATYPEDEGGVIRIHSSQVRSVSVADEQKSDIAPSSLPKWVRQMAPDEPVPPRPLSPSKPEGVVYERDSVVTSGQAAAMRRGVFIHQLLQYLPDVPVDKWETVIKRLKPADVDVPENLESLLKTEAYQFIFGANSLSEVPVVGVWKNKGVSGQIDRLIVGEKEVWIVDFKTNRHVPTTQASVPDVYKEQLSAYKGLIKDIFPDKVIKTYLLWTENLTLMEITE